MCSGDYQGLSLVQGLAASWCNPEWENSLSGSLSILVLAEALGSKVVRLRSLQRYEKVQVCCVLVCLAMSSIWMLCLRFGLQLVVLKLASPYAGRWREAM